MADSGQGSDNLQQLEGPEHLRPAADKDSTIPCTTAPPLTGLDVVMDSCNKFCGCKDEFNPIAQTGAAYDDFACTKNRSCRPPRISISWNYIKRPFGIELHVVTGVFILGLVPWQFLKAARQWNEFLLHHWIRRALLLLGVPISLQSCTSRPQGSLIQMYLLTPTTRSSR